MRITPHLSLPCFENSLEDVALKRLICDGLQRGKIEPLEIQQAFVKSSFPKRFVRLIFILYAPGQRRILVTRTIKDGALGFTHVLERLIQHPRCAELVSANFRLQIDFVQNVPRRVDFYTLGMEVMGDRHFEIGVDGLLIRDEKGKLFVFAPGDAYVRSIMGMGQLREYLNRFYSKEFLKKSYFECFRSSSYISNSKGWCALYRGHPVVGMLNRQKIEQALNLAIAHIKYTQQKDGKFLYYYDAAFDTKIDHEHPMRNPLKNPYYNILRHCGGAITCLWHEKLTSHGDTLKHISLAIDYLLKQARMQDYDGQQGAYIYSEKKSKLGGSGIALYLLAKYEIVSGDMQYHIWADRLACHLINQITTSGEFIYYNIYLDRPVSEVENASHFSFFYPGEAICGLAAYLHLLKPEQRMPIFKKLKLALHFLLDIRPITRASEYSVLPSDGWLMIGIMELWDFKDMQNTQYSNFVFSDAQKMIEHMYKVDNAPYPDYAGGFFYNFGDYPYADGARCEGLLGAYELAVKMGDTDKSNQLWQSIQLASWALLHLVNTEDSIYFAPKPDIALGGIRFKYTRQWFRIDTIQHVASFFAKLLPYWKINEVQ